MFTLAEELNGMVVFAVSFLLSQSQNFYISYLEEHRYYGVSLPFGNESFTIENLGYEK